MDTENITQKIESAIKAAERAGVWPRFLAVISYLNVLSLVPFVLKAKSEYVQFHARQGLTLFIAEIIFTLIFVIPFVGWVIGFLGWLACGVWSIIGLVNAILGRKAALPVISRFAQKIKI